MKKFLAGFAFAAVIFTFIAHATDVSRYLVGKGQELSQTNASSLVVVTNERPYRFTSFVEGVTNGLLQGGSLKLPNGQTRTFTNEDGTLNFEQGFANKAGLDAAYGTGGYQFTINSVNDGTNKPTLPLAAENYPNNPRVINWLDLQAVEPEFPLLISWNSFTNGNANDYVLLEINETNDSPVVSTPAC